MKENVVEATHTEDRVKKYYHWRASNYDAGSAFEVEHHLEAIRLSGIKPGDRVLDVACGTGRATVDLARSVGQTGSVEAVDLSEDMLARARQKLAAAGLDQRVHFQSGNARSLTFPGDAFDLVYNGYMFDLIPVDGFLPILREFYRVIKPGGRIVLVNMSKPDARKTFFEAVYSAGLAVMPCRPVLMEPLLKEVGFRNVSRDYRPTHGLIVSKLWGTEIVMGQK